MFRNTTCSIDKLVGLRTVNFILLIVNFSDPGSFYIAVLVLLSLLTLAHDRSAEGLLCHVKQSQFATVRYHVFIQFKVVTLGVAPHQPCLTVVVNEYGGVNMVPRTVLKQRFSNGITERSRRTVANGYTDGHTVRNPGMGTDIPIKLAVPLHALACPCSVVGPRKTFQSEGRTVILPVDHILGGIHTPLLHPEEIGIVFVMTGVNVHGTVMNHRSRVRGKPSLNKRILGMYVDEAQQT